MFKCIKCEALMDENKFLREQTRALTNQIIALSNPQTYGILNPIAPSDEFYGGENDEMVTYNEYGEKIIVKKKSE